MLAGRHLTAPFLTSSVAAPNSPLRRCCRSLRTGESDTGSSAAVVVGTIGMRFSVIEKAGFALILMRTCCGYRSAAICNPEAARENVVALLNGYLEELGQALTCKYLDSCISNCLLSDILELGNGFAFKSGAYTESGRYKVPTIKNVQDGNVDCSSSSRLDELPIKMKEHCKLKPGRNAAFVDTVR